MMSRGINPGMRKVPCENYRENWKRNLCQMYVVESRAICEIIMKTPAWSDRS